MLNRPYRCVKLRPTNADTALISPFRIKFQFLFFAIFRLKLKSKSNLWEQVRPFHHLVENTTSVRTTYFVPSTTSFASCVRQRAPCLQIQTSQLVLQHLIIIQSRFQYVPMKQEGTLHWFEFRSHFPSGMVPIKHRFTPAQCIISV